MNHPLTMTFRILALAPQVHVRDATGATVCYVRQKLLRLGCCTRSVPTG
jgi:hypothetical protein